MKKLLGLFVLLVSLCFGYSVNCYAVLGEQYDGDGNLIAIYNEDGRDILNNPYTEEELRAQEEEWRKSLVAPEFSLNVYDKMAGAHTRGLTGKNYSTIRVVSRDQRNITIYEVVINNGKSSFKHGSGRLPSTLDMGDYKDFGFWGMDPVVTVKLITSEGDWVWTFD